MNSHAAVYLDGIQYNVDAQRAGGMGKVWLLSASPGHQFDPIYRRQIAVKTFNEEIPESDVRRELDVWITLDHDRIVPLRKIGSMDFRLAALMPRLQGSLDDHLERVGCLDISSLLCVASDVTHALHFAWSRFGVLHLDLKPSNILVRTVDPLSVQVADWGIARISSSRNASVAAYAQRPASRSFDFTSYRAGTPLYMASERFRSAWPLSPSADLYSLGLMLIQCATGFLPFSFGSTNPLHEIIDGRYFANSIRLLSSVPTDIASLLLTCIDPAPDRRPSDFAAVLKVIERAGKRYR